MKVSTPDTLKVFNEADILICEIDNPPNNYLEERFFEGLYRCRDVMQSPDIKAVVFTATGKAFSKGADIHTIRSRKGSISRESLQLANDQLTFISRLEKPVVAAVSGLCLGGGLELALACHLRVCSDKARFGLPEMNLGLIPGLGGIHRLIDVVGEAKALEMLLLSDIISATKALNCHLVSRVFKREDFQNKVMLFVKNLIAVPRPAMVEMLRLIKFHRNPDEADMTREAIDSFLLLLSK